MSVAKPVIRNMLKSKTKIDFVIASVIGFGAALAYKYGVQHRRRQLFEDFYKTYDAQADYQRMKEAGVFKCFNKDE